MKSSRFDTRAEQRLVVYVPQLESLLREAGQLPPLIDALTRNHASHPLDPQSPQGELVAGSPLPAAPLTRRSDRPDDAQGAWLRADPVGLVPDLAAVWLQTDASFPSGEWSEALSSLLREEGLTLELTESGRGYVRLDCPPETLFSPPWTLAGASLEHGLPQGGDAQRWRRLLNETQVLLQQLRKAADDPAAIPGSLWFWGGGSLPDSSAIRPRVCRIVADDPVLVGLADWLGLPRRPASEEVEPLPGAIVEWPVRFDDAADDNLARLHDFLGAAWRRLRLGRIRRLELASTETVRRFSVGDAWRVWR
ncbi:MAG TPA: hypothetical protein VK972_04840 [Wenzhouxiangella sp.]|nr:hypothetical protein [Wenzhouxiangella sp.]